SRQGQGRASRVGRADPRRGRAAVSAAGPPQGVRPPPGGGREGTSGGGSPSILVVEDEPAILELLKVNLADAGYAVKAVEDAETARTSLNAELPDLLLLDWMLPGQSGLAFAKQLRGDPRTRELPIIMVTARSGEADKVA